MIKRHTKPNPQKRHPGRHPRARGADPHLEPDADLIPSSGKPTRVGRKRQEDGTGVRVAKKSGATLS